MERADAIVVGGGVVGLSAARALAGAGLRVLVLERRRVGAEASSAAAGMVAPQSGEGPEALLPLALRARDHHLQLAPALLEETGIDVELSTRGLLEAAFDEQDEAEIEARLQRYRRHGLPVEPLGPEELREAEPNLSPAARRGLFLSGDHHLDNVRLTRALAAAAVRRGAAIVSGRPVTGLLLEGGRLAGVRAGEEAWRAPLVLNAMGAWAGLLAGDPLPPPVEPVRGQMAAFDLAPPFLRHAVCSPRGYVVPRQDGRLLAGSTLERAGFEKSVTAGGLRSVLGIALEIAPRLADMRVAETWAGLRPGTRDGLPVIGAGAIEGLFHAAGLYRNGILLGPYVGELAAGLARGEGPPLDLSPFSVSRFRA